MQILHQIEISGAPLPKQISNNDEIFYLKLFLFVADVSVVEITYYLLGSINFLSFRLKRKHYLFFVLLVLQLGFLEAVPFFICFLLQQRVIVNTFGLKLCIHLLKLFADLFFIVQHIKLVVSVDPKKQLIFYILAEGLQTNLILDSKADHHHNVLLA